MNLPIPTFDDNDSRHLIPALWDGPIAKLKPLPLPLRRRMAATPFQQEAWSEYSIGMLILLLRIVVRCRLVGRKWDGDDYFTIAAVLFWTVRDTYLSIHR